MTEERKMLIKKIQDSWRTWGISEKHISNFSKTPLYEMEKELGVDFSKIIEERYERFHGDW